LELRFIKESVAVLQFLDVTSDADILVYQEMKHLFDEKSAISATKKISAAESVRVRKAKSRLEVVA
jgi:hypothetical protein